MKAQAGPGSRNAKSRLTERHGPGSGLANQQPGGWEGGYSRNGSLTTKTRHVSLSKTDERLTARLTTVPGAVVVMVRCCASCG